MGRWIKKLFHWTMHVLAVFLLLVAMATPIFWVRSRTRSEGVEVQWNSSECILNSWNGRAVLALQTIAPWPLAYEAWSIPVIPDAMNTWSYTAIGRDHFDPDHNYDFLGVVVSVDPASKELAVPDSYLLLFSLSVAAWWGPRVWKQRGRRQVGFPVEPPPSAE